MNHLAHFKLAAGSADLLIGNMLADEVRGRLSDRFSPGIAAGIQLHRSIDAFTDAHPLVQASHARFDKPYRRYGGIITDIVYDHFLAKSWQHYHTESLEDFCTRSLSEALLHADQLSESSLRRVKHMQANRSMEKYGSTAFIERSFEYLSGKLKRDNPLASGFTQFEKHAQSLEADFTAFFPELMTFSNNWVQLHSVQNYESTQLAQH
jgi:acyl carrier protein phosphodiesterase